MSDDEAVRSGDAAYLQAHFDPATTGDFEMLAAYRPDVVAGYLDLRRIVRDANVDGGLTPRERELIILAIEIARTKTNPPPLRHARIAIDEGATAAEVADVVSLCILIGGMLTFAESGRFALKAAVEHERERAVAATG